MKTDYTNKTKLRKKRSKNATPYKASQNRSSGKTNLKKSKLKTNRKQFLWIDFLLVIILVVILDFLFVILPGHETSDTENRNLQQMPKATLHTLTSGSFENDFEDYISDQFPFRNAWINLQTTVSRMMGKTESNGIFLGKNGYLIQNFTEPSEENYEKLTAAMVKISKISDQITTRALIAPTAVLTYAGKLPFGAPAGDEGGFLDRLSFDLGSSGISFIDTRDRLASADEQLYYRTDHHWTTPAAYLAYLDYLQSAGLSDSTDYTPLLVSDSFKGTLSATSGFRSTETDKIYIYQPSQETDYTVTYVSEAQTSASVYAPENLKGKDQYALFLNGNHPLVTIDTATQTDDILLILKDSYANCFIPFLIPEYKRIIIVDPRYYTDDFKTLVQTENITDILFLYNACTLATDTNLSQLVE